MMGDVLHISRIGAVIADLDASYRQGNLTGLIVVTLNHDGTFSFASEGLNYIEQLGLLAATMETVNALART